MRLTIKSIIQQAMLAAAPALIVGCGPADRHVELVVPWSGPAPSSLDTTTCHGLCAGGPLGMCASPDFKGCDPIALTADGGLEIDCNDGPPPSTLCTGRRPARWVEARASGSMIGSYFAQAAHLEAASVIAFRSLARELDAHRAPARLIRAAQRSARDEVRHTRAMSALARRFGARVPRVDAPAVEVRPLEEVARENALEGCVRETYGAAVGAYQSRAARDAQVARAMAAIAEDEAAHAQLAWDIHRWVAPKLSAPARRRIAQERRAAYEALRRAPSLDGELAALAGLPDSAARAKLLGALEHALMRA